MARYSPLNYTVTLKLEFGLLKVIESCTIGSADPENPTVDPNITSISKPVAKLWPFYAYPRWPSAAILDFVEPQIAPFDPLTPKTLA